MTQFLRSFRFFHLFLLSARLLCRKSGTLRCSRTHRELKFWKIVCLRDEWGIPDQFFNNNRQILFCLTFVQIFNLYIVYIYTMYIYSQDFVCHLRREAFTRIERCASRAWNSFLFLSFFLVSVSHIYIPL